MEHYQEVLFEEKHGKDGHLGIITLNRPDVLNALNHTMIKAIQAQLQRWANAMEIKAVVIRAAEGRAFCAGGDLRLTYERARAHDRAMTDFFREEYQLNRFIFHFPKPYIALLDGITMGGGVGISIHGSHRVATDRLLFAMPETGIGFFPDVGGTYFLPRLPGKIGYYLGLTGARLNADECVAIGLVQQKVPQEKLSKLIDALAQESLGQDPRATVTRILDEVATPIGPSRLLENEIELNKGFSAHSMDEIVEALQHSSNELCREALAAFAKKSPTSLKITLRALQNGEQLNFDACMNQEYRLVCHFLLGHDFIEGIRALIIDKDQKPQWKPATLKEVHEAEIEKYFAPLARELTE